MPAFKVNTSGNKGPEAEIQKRIIKTLTLLGWFVKETHGNMYQNGFPDLYATHKNHGARWIEVKNKDKYKFTPAQLRDFPMLCANGAGVWILVDDTPEEIRKLFKPFNWHTYL